MTQTDNLFEIAQEIDQHLQAVRQMLKQPLENAFGPGELTGPQRSVLQALVPTQGLSLKDLSKSVGLAHSTVSGIVDRLEARALVKRLPGEPDRRLTRIVVTDGVMASVRDHLSEFSISPLMTALGRAEPEDRAAILASLRKLRTLLESRRAAHQGH